MPRRFKVPINARVGSSRLLSTDTSSQAQFTKGIRDQMAVILKNFTSFTQHLTDEGGEILVEALTPTFERSKELVPKDTSALLNSGYLEKRTLRNRVVVEIGYSRGGNPHYGPFVHENLEVFHEEPTQAKFLEAPLLENADQIRADIIKGFKEASGV